MSSDMHTTSPRRFGHRTATALAALCALAVLPAAPAAAASKHKHKRCNLSGTNLAHSKRVRVVLVKTHDGGQTMRGCVRPNGRVFTLASLGDLGLGGGTISLEQVAGTWVSIKEESSNQYNADLYRSVIDLRTGHGYSIFSVHEGIGESGPFPDVDAYVLDSHGRTAVAEHVVTFDAAGHAVVVEQIDAYAPDGTGLVLDSGDPKILPSASLTFSAGVIGWNHGTEHRAVHFR